MVGILDLPEEVLCVIVKHLDTASQISVWETCELLRRALRWREAVRRVRIWRGCVLRRALELGFLTELADHIEVLDLSYLDSFDKPAVIPALKRLTQLRSLDVTYTDFTVTDAFEICFCCPAITRLAVVFTWPKTKIERISQLIYRTNIARLEYIHFAGSFTDLCTCIHPFDLLWSCKNLKELKLTVVRHNDRAVDREHINCKPMTKLWSHQLEYFSCHIYNTSETSEIFKELPLKRYFDFVKWDFAVFRRAPNDLPVISLSEDLYREAKRTQHWGRCCRLLGLGNGVRIPSRRYTSIYMWHKDLATADLHMHENIIQAIYKMLPSNICSPSCNQREMRYAAGGSEDSVFVSPCTWRLQNAATESCSSQKRLKVGDSFYDLNAVEYLTRDRKYKVSYKHTCDEEVYNCNRILDHNIPVLQKIVYFSASNLHLDLEFFQVLFETCVSLETLNVDAWDRPPFCRNILKTIHLSKSLRNLRIMDQIMGYKEVLKSLAECPTLENVHLCDSSKANYAVFQPNEEDYKSFFTKCHKLASLQMYSRWKSNIKDKQISMINQILRHMDRDVDVNLYSEKMCNLEELICYDMLCDMFFEPFDITNLNEKVKLKINLAEDVN